MRHEMIICTRNRPNDLRRCLESVAEQKSLPDRLIIVDSSDADSTRQVVEGFAETHDWMSVKFLRAAPRKTVQLNMALDLLDKSTDFVHFTDDDIILDPEYTSEILALFEESPSCGGIGGRISNLSERRASGLARWYRCLFLLDSPRQGALLSSGMNVMCRTGSRPRRVGWLSGCSMSYRHSAIRGLRFDETRAGNGMGEDVDFSARVAERTELLWTPRAVLDHLLSPINREDDLWVRRRGIRSRWRLAVLGVSPVSRAAVLYSVLGDALMLLAMAGVFRSRRYMREAAADAAAVLDIVKGVPV
ncbi:glycosyltransferase family A protein [Streptomyces sp. NPDC002935]|uniref:glycosyltransferase family A protein n=1 Tax=unclassified Streptomyces TaxID=2593676 RepID=UPI0033235BF0